MVESVKSRIRLSLADAVRNNRLPEFVAQETNRGVGPAVSAAFEAAMTSVIAQKSTDQTSHSPSDDGSTGM